MFPRGLRSRLRGRAKAVSMPSCTGCAPCWPWTPTAAAAASASTGAAGGLCRPTFRSCTPAAGAARTTGATGGSPAGWPKLHASAFALSARPACPPWT
eukprot:11975808-Alexandrium_andersonii.AAC.1